MAGYASRFNGQQSEWTLYAASTYHPVWSIKKAVPFTPEFPDDGDLFYLVLCGLKKE